MTDRRPPPELAGRAPARPTSSGSGGRARTTAPSSGGRAGRGTTCWRTEEPCLLWALARAHFADGGVAGLPGLRRRPAERTRAGVPPGQGPRAGRRGADHGRRRRARALRRARRPRPRHRRAAPRRPRSRRRGASPDRARALEQLGRVRRGRRSSRSSARSSRVRTPTSRSPGCSSEHGYEHVLPPLAELAPRRHRPRGRSAPFLVGAVEGWHLARTSVRDLLASRLLARATPGPTSPPTPSASAPCSPGCTSPWPRRGVARPATPAAWAAEMRRPPRRPRRASTGARDGRGSSALATTSWRRTTDAGRPDPHPRRPPPRPGDQGRHRLARARLRGRAGSAARRSLHGVVAAARRRRHAAVVPLRRRRRSGRLGRRDAELDELAAAWEERNREAFLDALPRPRRHRRAAARPTRPPRASCSPPSSSTRRSTRWATSSGTARTRSTSRWRASSGWSRRPPVTALADDLRRFHAGDSPPALGAARRPPPRRRRRHALPVWAPKRAGGLGRRATGTAGPRAPTRCSASTAPACGRPASVAGPGRTSTSWPSSAPTAPPTCHADPDGERWAEVGWQRQCGVRQPARVGRRRVDGGPPRASTRSSDAAQRLRGAPRVVAAAPRRSLPRLPRAGAAPRRPRRRARLHPRRAAARRRAPLRAVVGLPGHRLLRARPAASGRPTTSAGSSTTSTSAASACSSTGCRPTSRRTSGPWRASTARRSTSTPTPGGPSTPTGARSSSTSPGPRCAASSIANALFWLERAPRRRPARRRRRLDALPRLLAGRRRVDARTAHGGNEDLDAVAFLQELNAVVHDEVPGALVDRRGVHRLGRRQPAGRRGRPRVHPQVEHGLDARHARLLVDDPQRPPLAPRPAHLRAHLRVGGALRAAAVARRGRAPQEAAARQDARRRRRGAVRRPPGAATRGCGRTPASSCSSWARELAEEREWSHDRELDWGRLDDPLPAGVAAPGRRRSTPSRRAHPALHAGRRRPARVRLAVGRRGRGAHVRLRALVARAPTRSSSWSPTCPTRPPALPRRAGARARWRGTRSSPPTTSRFGGADAGRRRARGGAHAVAGSPALGRARAARPVRHLPGAGAPMTEPTCSSSTGTSTNRRGRTPGRARCPSSPSAAPFHDWNERITAECYRPNGWVSIAGADGGAEVVSTYEHLSFNVGPTLLSWLEAHHPDVYERILAADRRTGRAIAQAYGHAILPLCNERDLRTQVRWGQADFAHRFGRPADGHVAPRDGGQRRGARRSWPRRASASRSSRPSRSPACGRSPAADVDGRTATSTRTTPTPPLDTSRPLRWRHPDRADLGVDLVVYDGALAHALAFSEPTQRDDHRRGGRPRRPDGGLVAAATDGETFGHHHQGAERGAGARARRRGAGARHRRRRRSPSCSPTARPPTRRGCARAPGPARTASGAGRSDCGCSHRRRRRAGPRPGERRCARPSTCCATGASRSSTGVARRCCAIRGRRATPTSTC